jgi:hypothetical protein
MGPSGFERVKTARAEREVERHEPEQHGLVTKVSRWSQVADVEGAVAALELFGRRTPPFEDSERLTVAIDRRNESSSTFHGRVRAG